LKAVVREAPEDEREMFTQSVAEEIIHLREAALRLVDYSFRTKHFPGRARINSRISSLSRAVVS
jgi:hypothetical protein